VQRQYTGTAGKVTNCQVGVFLAYAVPAAGTRVLVDRELYVPRSWTGDRDRCDEAGISEDVAFATKPQLARTMVERVRELGLPFAWFTADEACGDNGKLREWLEKEGICHVVAVARDTTVPAGAGRTIRADQLAARVPGKGWQRLSCGHGSKGERLYDWAISPAGPAPAGPPLPGLGRAGVLPVLVPQGRAAGRAGQGGRGRWAIEEGFQAAKNEAALDHYQVRKHVAWYRHVTLALVARAWLAAAAARPPGALPGSGPGEGGRAREGAGDLWTTSRPAAALE
jgi:SRSO17 transposase